eukprot:c22683_g1_i7 orf=229-1062(+)
MHMSLISKCVVAGIVLVLARVCISSKRKHLASLEGKHVVITGGSCGIGFALAKECLSQGASVTLIARNLSRLSRAADILSSTCGTLATSPHGKILLKAVDVSDATAVSVAIAECFEWKPIDILICNAGTLIPGFLDNATVNELETVIKTNILGCVYPVHAALPLMKARCKEHPSSIVLMSSLSGLLFVSGLNVYTATKYALKGLAEMLRFELMPHNIRISLVCPGFVETAMLDEGNPIDYKSSRVFVVVIDRTARRPLLVHEQQNCTFCQAYSHTQE